MRLPDLNILEAYECQEVILKFSRDYKVTLVESKMLFRETMKMLWLMVKHRLEQNDATDCFVPSDFIVQKAMDPLDKMWHEFILFTQDYHNFCENYFGTYLHHVPCSEKEFQSFQQRKVERKENFEKLEREKLKIFVTYIQQNLGDETLEAWFKQIPRLVPYLKEA
jgi:hypothetical protein